MALRRSEGTKICKKKSGSMITNNIKNLPKLVPGPLKILLKWQDK